MVLSSLFYEFERDCQPSRYASTIHSQPEGSAHRQILRIVTIIVIVGAQYTTRAKLALWYDLEALDTSPCQPRTAEDHQRKRDVWLVSCR
jgi:hypothetical protein